MIRVLLDTNVLVSALLSAKGAPAELVRRWTDGEFEVVTSPKLIDELKRTLAHPKLGKWIGSKDAAEYLELVQAHADLVQDRDDSSVDVRDPLDAFVLALARDVDLIVSGDRDVLAAGAPVPILTPRAFLEALDG